MDTRQELIYREFVQRENLFLHAPYYPELEFYAVIRSGDIERTRELCRIPLTQKEGLGVLSMNELRHFQYHFAITAALIARYCIEGGMELSAAYSLSDFYIQRADRCRTPKEISDLHTTMCMDYAEQMNQITKVATISPQIVLCQDYIYNHLHEKITVAQLAKYVSLSADYVSRLFKKELGIGVSRYILSKKIETAKNMLLYSQYTISEISTTLAFSTQSYFTEQFRKQTGTTPADFRVKKQRILDIGGERS